jgi:flagellar basal-body rod protein FlgF
MDGMVYIATSGADQMLTAQNVHANNLANLKTQGFRADLVQMQSKEYEGEGFASKAFVMSEEAAVDFSTGDIYPTGRELDVAIKGEGWLVVQTEAGTEAYTRNGGLQINQDGTLSVGGKLPVLGTGGLITVPPYEKFDIAGDGTISIIPIGGTNPVILDRVKLVNPEPSSLHKGYDGLIRSYTVDEAEPDSNVRLVGGFLEGSNVNAVDAITSMISLARQFELHLKLVNFAKENDQANATLLSIA